MEIIGENIKIDEKNIGDVLVLEIAGSLTALTCLTAEPKILNAIQQSTKVILNFKNTIYLSSAGIRLLLQAKKKSNKILGELILCEINEHIMKVVNISGVDRFFTIVPSEEAALSVFKKNSKV